MPLGRQRRKRWPGVSQWGLCLKAAAPPLMCAKKRERCRWTSNWSRGNSLFKSVVTPQFGTQAIHQGINSSNLWSFFHRKNEGIHPDVTNTHKPRGITAYFDTKTLNFGTFQQKQAACLCKHLMSTANCRTEIQCHRALQRQSRGRRQKGPRTRQSRLRQRNGKRRKGEGDLSRGLAFFAGKEGHYKEARKGQTDVSTGDNVQSDCETLSCVD